MSAGGDQLRALAKQLAAAPEKLAREARDQVVHAGAVLEAGARGLSDGQVTSTSTGRNGVRVEASGSGDQAPLGAGAVNQAADGLAEGLANAGARALGGR